MLQDNIRKLRKEAGLSQEQMAERLAVSRQAVTKWETGAGAPDLENVVAIARLFNVTVDSLLNGDPTQVGRERLGVSITQCDVLAECDFDIDFGHARLVTLRGVPMKKVRVELQSDQIDDVESAFGVRLDSGGKSFDIQVERREGVTCAEARASLDILLELPEAWCNSVEITGNADEVRAMQLSAHHLEVGGKLARFQLNGVTGRVELDTNEDVAITCDELPERLEVNQVASTSVLAVPVGAAFCTRTRGFGNRIVLRGVEEAPEASCSIELCGMRSELTIQPASA